MDFENMSREELIEALKWLQQNAETTSGKNVEDSVAALGNFFSKIAIAHHKLSPDGTIIDINPTELDLIGYTKEELVNRKKWSNLIIPEQKQRFNKHLKKLKQEKASHNVSFTLVTKDQNYIDILLSAYAVFDLEGRLCHTHELLIDTSIHREADRLQRNLSAIVQSSDDAIIGKTLDGIITSWNPGAEKIYGYKAKEVLGKHITIIQPKGIPEDIPKIMKKIRNGESVKHYETQRRRRNGEVFAVSVTVSPIRDNEGKIIGASAIGRDISSRKKFEEKLKTYAEELRESNKALERFAYVVAHDLQSPLVTIQGFADLLLQESAHKLNAEEQDSLQSMIKASKRMNKLIKDLLMLSRATHQNVTFRPVDLNKLLNNVKDDLKSNIEASHTILEIDPLPTIEADGSQLYSVFLNLISNGIKYNDSPQPRIIISSHRKDGSYTFSVQDNGIGISREQMKSVFNPFERFSKKTPDKGSGLGLSICRKIIERHNGLIWVETELKKGSTFYFTLPEKQKKQKMAG